MNADQPQVVSVSSRSRSRWNPLRRRRPRRRFLITDWEPTIAGLSHGQQRYVLLRWANSIETMERRHSKDVLWYFILRSVSVLGGVAITALSGIGLSGTSASGSIRWVIFGLGFLVAGAAALEQLGHYAEHRMLSRQAREDLLTEGFGYLFPSPTENGNAFEGFRNSVEAIIKQYNQRYDKTISAQ
jgi:hypothetical protein